MNQRDYIRAMADELEHSARALRVLAGEVRVQGVTERTQDALWTQGNELRALASAAFQVLEGKPKEAFRFWHPRPSEAPQLSLLDLELTELAEAV